MGYPVSKNQQVKIWSMIILLFLAGAFFGGGVVGILWKRDVKQLVNLGESFQGTSLLFNSLARDADLTPEEKRAVAPMFGQLMSQTLFTKMRVQPDIDRGIIENCKRIKEKLPPEKAAAVEEFLWILIRRGRPYAFQLLIEAVAPTLEELVLIDEVLVKHMTALSPGAWEKNDLKRATLVEDILRNSVTELGPQLPKEKRKRLEIFYANFLRGFPKRDKIPEAK